MSAANEHECIDVDQVIPTGICAICAGLPVPPLARRDPDLADPPTATEVQP